MPTTGQPAVQEDDGQLALSLITQWCLQEVGDPWSRGFIATQASLVGTAGPWPALEPEAPETSLPAVRPTTQKTVWDPSVSPQYQTTLGS